LVLEDRDCPRSFVKLGFGSDLFHPLELSCRGSCDQDVVIVFMHRFNDASDLFHCFSLTENHFWKTLAQAAMVIDVCESKVLEWQ
jgi:hypothetical protein